MSTLAPVLSGAVDWRRAADFHLTTPFDGWFGGLTSLMAGLYLVGFAAPAFEAGTWTCDYGDYQPAYFLRDMDGDGGLDLGALFPGGIPLINPALIGQTPQPAQQQPPAQQQQPAEQPTQGGG